MLGGTLESGGSNNNVYDVYKNTSGTWVITTATNGITDGSYISDVSAVELTDEAIICWINS